MSEDFHLFLTSNVKPNVGSQKSNKIGDFITHLPEKKFLSDEYEVALANISYTKSWWNIAKPEKFTVAIVDAKVPTSLTLTLPPGEYNEKMFTKEITNLITYASIDPLKPYPWLYDSPTIKFDNETKKFVISI